MIDTFTPKRPRAPTITNRARCWLRLYSPATRARLLREANAAPTYRARQSRRADLGVGTLADYAWFGCAEDWERAKKLAKAGLDELI